MKCNLAYNLFYALKMEGKMWIVILSIQELFVERDENKINIWELDLKSSNVKVQLELSKWLLQGYEYCAEKLFRLFVTKILNNAKFQF